ncbi:Maf family protein [Peptostreptococcus canis]|uniref:dTTP/UTP pyrophosphatase n=1 Tax=Peptostreptococcus canis TaxID=1159213 RepID=A0ABR6TKI4_9FIRM|nr:Maf family protein [Peptostreptococcus canis]MBC2575914.1 septum formation protein Maf [Peptostreptococcus canis]MBP1997965.1 septum formation protein [Peptostreptococcus canis]
MDIILASRSPRRKELLEMCGLKFKTISSTINEDAIAKKIYDKYNELSSFEKADKLTYNLAFEKANSVFKKNKNSVVIGSDTIVVSENSILGKPKNDEAAYDMLVSLCGKKHRVYTGLSIISKERIDTFTTFTEVEFFPFDEYMNNIIKKYIDTKSPLDKAGGYGIQDMGALLVKEIKGDYYTVMGLPISLLYRKLIQKTE